MGMSSKTGSECIGMTGAGSFHTGCSASACLNIRRQDGGMGGWSIPAGLLRLRLYPTLPRGAVHREPIHNQSANPILMDLAEEPQSVCTDEPMMKKSYCA